MNIEELTREVERQREHRMTMLKRYRTALQKRRTELRLALEDRADVLDLCDRLENILIARKDYWKNYALALEKKLKEKE